MKNSIIAILILSNSISLFSQKDLLELKVEEKTGGCYVLLYERDSLIDTLLISMGSLEIIDQKIMSPEKILYIKKIPAGFWYYKMELSDGYWDLSNTSGQVGPNPGSYSYYDPKQHGSLNVEYSIIEEDKVLIKNGDKEWIVDCQVFAKKKEERLERMKH